VGWTTVFAVIHPTFCSELSRMSGLFGTALKAGWLMKPNFRYKSLLVFIWILTVAGCSILTQPAEIGTPAVAQAETESLLTLNLTDAGTPSATAVPPTATHTSTLTLTPTWTPLPTLKPEQAQEILKTWLQGTETCLAPCFWNITPGQTSLDEAINIFAHLGLQMELTNERDKKAFYEIIYKFESGLSVSPLFTIQDEIVRNIEVGIHPEKSQGPEVPREWLAYSPETLIRQYGLPSQVDFFIGRNRDNDASPSIWYDMVSSHLTV
jgi:hypothetical protein